MQPVWHQPGSISPAGALYATQVHNIHKNFLYIYYARACSQVYIPMSLKAISNIRENLVLCVFTPPLEELHANDVITQIHIKYYEIIRNKLIFVDFMCYNLTCYFVPLICCGKGASI